MKRKLAALCLKLAMKLIGDRSILALISKNMFPNKWVAITLFDDEQDFKDFQEDAEYLKEMNEIAREEQEYEGEEEVKPPKDKKPNLH